MPLVKLHTAVQNTIEEVSERVRNGGVSVVGISSGFPNLDEATGGFRKDALYTLAGRPGMGKTAMALSIALNVARNKHKVLFLSLEMDANLLALRVLSGLSGIAAEAIEKGRLTQAELEQVRSVVDQTKDLTFGILDDSIVSSDFVEYVQDLQGKHGLDFLVVDYISLFRDPNNYGENERISRVVGNMRQTARACNIPVLQLAQLNREVEKREGHLPVMSDLRDSGAIEQDSFFVGFALRPQYYAAMEEADWTPVEVERDAQLIIAKNRQGPTGKLGLHFHPKRMLWTPKEAVTPAVPNPTEIESTNEAMTLVEKVRKRK